MSNVVFTTEGQAKVLADQEAIAKKGREVTAEFEAGAKATKSWDSNLAQLKRQGESALRSIQTEQEKIVQQIAAIQTAVGKGLYQGREKEAEEAIARLRQRWVDVDQATVAANQKTDAYAANQSRLKSAAESALGSVRTELERIAEQIAEVEAAQKDGLIPPDEAEEGLKRLRAKYDEIEESTKEIEHETSRFGNTLRKAFDITHLAKFAATFIGIKAIIGEVRKELEDLQTKIDRRIAAGLKPKERAEQYEKDIESARSDAQRAREEEAGRRGDLGHSQTDAAERERERRASAEERIGDLEQNLGRARQDRQAAVERVEKSQAAAGQRYDEQRADAEKRLARAEADLRRAKTESQRRAAGRRVEDARTGLSRLDEEYDVDSGGVRSADRRIADLERDLARAQRDLAKGGDSTSVRNAQRSLAAAEAKTAEAEERAAALEKEFAAFKQSPEGQRYQAIKDRGDAADKAFQEIAALGDAGQLATEELERFAGIFRELGHGAMERKLRNFLNRIDDGTISVEEVIAQLQSEIEKFRNITRDRTLGGGGEFGGGDIIPGRELTPQESATVLAINQLVVELQRSEQGRRSAVDAQTQAIVRALEAQQALLQQILDGQETGGGGP